ncbi:MAG TPA: hypothetical protein VEK32_06005 [Thermodesulfobacteriota bacterium]|nr:hypothetical protein [Thermodesulfobacteriota bacterium]
MDKNVLINQQEKINAEETEMDLPEAKNQILLPGVSEELDADGNGDRRQNETHLFHHKGLFSGLFKNQPQDEIQDSPLRGACHMLKEWGIHPLHMKAAALTVLAFNSPRLNFPINLALTEEDAGGGELLNLCRRLVPPDGVIESIDVPDVSRQSLKGKTIFLPEYGEKNKKLGALMRLLKYGRVQQSNLKGMKDAREMSEGPTALICFLKEKDSEILSFPFIFHLHLTSPNLSNLQRALQEERLRHSESFESDLKYLHVRALLGRLIPRDVNIPFFDQIVNSISDKIPNYLEVIRFVTNVIKVITIINHFTPASEQEIIRTYLSASAGEGVGQVQSDRCLLLPPGNASLLKGLTSTVYDFFCAKCLLEGLPLNRDDQLGGRTFRVYEAIKTINLDYLSVFGLKDNELLDTLEHPNHTRGWPGVRQIHAQANKDQVEVISQSTVNKEVEFLIEHDYIQQREIARNPVKYVYAIKTLSVGPCSIKLPNPKDLYDLSSDGPIPGRNPLTGEVVEI